MTTPEDERPTPADEQASIAEEERSQIQDTVEEQLSAAAVADTDVSDDSDSSSNAGSDAGAAARADPAPTQPTVQWLATGREKRSTAGNRLKHMIAAQEPDDELELLFAEDGDDAAFSEADDDGSDLHMDSSSDDEDAQNEGDELEGEKELEKKARENRQAMRKRKAQEAIPIKFRKKVKIAAPRPNLRTEESGSSMTSASRTPGGTGHVPRPKKKSERTSWLPSVADMPTRASRRETTMMSKEQLHQQMIEREVKRIKQVEAMERKAKRMEALRKPPKTQAERLAEAAIIERKNAKSLNRWEEAEKLREEERRAKLAALNNRTLDGPVVTFWSGVGEWVGGKLKYVGKTLEIEEKPAKKKRSQAQEADDAGQTPMEEGSVAPNQANSGQREGQTPSQPPPALTEISQAGGLITKTEEAEGSTALKEVKEVQPTPAEGTQEGDLQTKSTTEAKTQPATEPTSAEPLAETTTQADVQSGESKDAEIGIVISTETSPPALSQLEVLASKDNESEVSSSLLAEQPSTEKPDTQMRSEETTSAHTTQPTETDKPVQDVVMEDAGAAVPASVTPEPAQSKAEISQPGLQPPTIAAPGPTTSPSGIYTTLGFAPPAQLAMMNPPGMESPPASFLARPAGVSPGELSIPQIGQSTASGTPSVLALPQMDHTQKTPQAGLQATLATQPLLAPSGLTTQAGQPGLAPAGQMIQPHGLPAQSLAPGLPPLAPKKASNAGRKKKEKEKEEPPSPPRTPPPDGKATRNCFILQNFNENAIKEKSVQTRILFGKEMNKLAKPTPAPRCVITGQPARYKDPKTGLPYYNSFAYKEIQKLQKGEYKFSKLSGTWMGTGATAAAGVPARFLDPTAPGPPKPEHVPDPVAQNRPEMPAEVGKQDGAAVQPLPTTAAAPSAQEGSTLPHVPTKPTPQTHVVKTAAIESSHAINAAPVEAPPPSNPLVVDTEPKIAVPPQVSVAESSAPMAQKLQPVTEQPVTDDNTIPQPVEAPVQT